MSEKPKKIEKVRDKYWEENRPGVDYDFIEWLCPPNELDAIVRANSAKFGFIEELDPADFLPDRKKQEELLQQIYAAAAKVLTPQQYKIFLMRYLFGLKEVDIAKQMGVSQPYIAANIPVVHSKIRKALLLEPTSKRGRKRLSKNVSKKQPKKPISKKP
jgi:hypothetical protein